MQPIPPQSNDAHSAHPAQRSRPDTGATLLEILISIALLGTIVIALATAVQAMLTTSSTIYDAGRVETVLLNVSDQIERSEPRCNYNGIAETVAVAEGWPSGSVTVTVERLQSNTGDPNADWVPEDCGVALEAFDVQRLVISATHPNEQITRTLTVVKSDVS